MGSFLKNITEFCRNETFLTIILKKSRIFINLLILSFIF